MWRRLDRPRGPGNVPGEGAANSACCAFVAELLGLRPSQVSICLGQKSRDTVLLIAGLSAVEMRTRIQDAAAES